MLTLTLKRTEYSSQGVFGTLSIPGTTVELVTLEHAYPVTGIPDTCLAKIPASHGAAYKCARGTHTVGTKTFETFEVTGVTGHWGILFHVGNTNQDSDGCVLLGLRRDADGILQSRSAFGLFMQALQGQDEFLLEVI